LKFDQEFLESSVKRLKEELKFDSELILSHHYEGQEHSNLPHKFHEHYTELIGEDKIHTINSYNKIGMPDPHDLERAFYTDCKHDHGDLDIPVGDGILDLVYHKSFYE